MNLCFRFANSKNDIPVSTSYAVVSGELASDDKDLIVKVMEVLRSDLVFAVRRVMGSLDQILYLSDMYDLEPGEKERPARQPHATKHKISGLYFNQDAPEGPNTRHLLPGITGAQHFLEKAREADKFQVEIDVVWGLRIKGRIRIAKGFEEVEVRGVKIGGNSRPVVTFYHPDWSSVEGKETTNSLGRMFGFQA